MTVRDIIGIIRLVAVFHLTGCLALLTSSQSTDAITIVPIADLAAERRLDQAWRFTSADSGGYASISNFAGPPSLVNTSWNLRISSQLGSMSSALDIDQTVAILESIVGDSTAQDEISEMHAIWLATRGLIDLGRAPLIPTIQRQLERLRAGEGYAFYPGQPFSWAATLGAVEILSLVNESPLPGIRSALLAELPATMQSGGEGTSERDAHLLTLLSLAGLVLSDEERATHRAGLEPWLNGLYASVTAAPFTDGLSVWIAHSLRRIAVGIELPVAAPGPGAFDRLVTASGQLALAQGQQVPDPQTTSLAIDLGWTSSPHLIESLDRTAAPHGWFGMREEADPRGTTYAVLVSHALGLHHRDGAVSTQVAEWLASAAIPTASADAYGPNLPTLFYVLVVADTLGVAVPDTVPRKIDDLLNDPTVLSWDAGDLAWLARVAMAGDASIPSPLGDQIETIVGSLTVERMSDVAIITILATATSDVVSVERIANEASMFLTDADHYRDGLSVPVPDIRSTAVGLSVSHRLPTDGPGASTVFMDESGPWWYPPGTPEASDGITLDTMYLHHVLLGGIPIANVGVL